MTETNLSFFLMLPLKQMQKLFYAMTSLIRAFLRILLKPWRILKFSRHKEPLREDTLRTAVSEAKDAIAIERRHMLLSIFDLEEMTVNDIMVPRNEMVGIDIAEDWEILLEQLRHSQHTRLLVYENSMENIIGVLHLRLALSLTTEQGEGRAQLRTLIQPIASVPEHTPLNRQLIHFKKDKTRMALVVDEYGDIQGLVTLEDILEEIVGEFTTDIATQTEWIHPQTDGSYLVDGTLTIRELNRDMSWELPSEGPKTLSGLLIEYLEYIPQPGLCVRIAGYPIEIVKVKDNLIKTARVLPLLYAKNT